MRAATEVKRGTRKKAEVGVRENAELKHRDADGLRGAFQFYFRPGSGARRNIQNVWCGQGSHTLIRTGSDLQHGGNRVARGVRVSDRIGDGIARSTSRLGVADSGYWRRCDGQRLDLRAARRIVLVE